MRKARYALPSNGGRLLNFAFFEAPNVIGTVDIQLAVYVIDLVLKDAGQPTLGPNTHRLPLAIEALDGHGLVSLDLANKTWERKAPLMICSSFLGMPDNLWVGQDVELGLLGRVFWVVAGFGVFHHDEAQIETNLWRGQTDSGSRSHGLDHVLNESLQLGRECTDPAGWLPENWVR